MAQPQCDPLEYPIQSELVDQTELRARFAQALADLYGSEVPAYNLLVDVSRAVNRDVLAARGHDAERLGDIDRVTAERHGAIRVGSPEELAQAARIFAAFGMHPVGFYDLRESAGAGVPVVSTAFRPVDQDELARNPFRVFTSMLAVDDRRYFDPSMQHALGEFLSARRLFGADLLTLADEAVAEGGLDRRRAEQLLRLATDAFRLSRAPINRTWHDQLAAISSVAADIGGTPTTHINHLTPRVLDIADLYSRMQQRGIEMIDAIQGPPAWDGPDVLLRQTSFRALAERRWFATDDGTVAPGELRVRFGEVEQRGIALTPEGMQRYEEGIGAIRRATADADSARDDVAGQIWADTFPRTESKLAAQGIGWFTYRARPEVRPSEEARLSCLVESGAVVAEPIVYEDFLPRSAAGIFQSNLTSHGARDESVGGADYDRDRLEEIVARPVHDPQQLYHAQRDRSLRIAGAQLGVRIVDDVPVRH